MHEVWHNGTEQRIVLIVDIWHPELTFAQREATITDRDSLSVFRQAPGKHVLHRLRREQKQQVNPRDEDDDEDDDVSEVEKRTGKQGRSRVQMISDRKA